tara:strand:+ start:287 stop:667 length:381 start_codon:yes stop_codon:yes gene_type:complete
MNFEQPKMTPENQENTEKFDFVAGKIIDAITGMDAEIDITPEGQSGNQKDFTIKGSDVFSIAKVVNQAFSAKAPETEQGSFFVEETPGANTSDFFISSEKGPEFSVNLTGNGNSGEHLLRIVSLKK